ncbi:EI24 domain-containing protein [Microbacterium sp. cf332]|uniref:EI24 domain-containing protein n=1 Tax=Microbacterium sp. cf332 TaxID=1761804 RepID=UPI000881902C|nr:EI24 domain-containing protein [Microbacterium sp. cf332]SDQ52047.1 CysZ protein [Microbacterium sp. cf332]
MPDAVAPPAAPARSFLRGAADLGRGFGFWSRRPGVMALGLIPAAIVGLVLLGGLITLVAFLPQIVDALTPFADRWPDLWADVVRIAAGTALLGAAIVLVAVSFTALTLMVGEPFYDRIWRAAEADLGGAVPASESGFWRSVGDAIGLVARGLLAALIAALVGLVPVVGGVLGSVTAVSLTGWLLADELTSRALAARGVQAAGRRRLRRAHRARFLGFGVATQLCFLVPLGAVVVMPAAVAGSTRLVRTVLADRD